MNVIIEIINTQTSEGETQKISDKTKGEFISDENGFSLRYADKKLGGHTAVTVSGGDFVSVVRTGSGYDTEMFFEKGKRRPLVYNTPYGEIMLETDTKKISSLSDGKSGFIEFEYDLLQGGNKQSGNRMKIKFSEEANV